MKDNVAEFLALTGKRGKQQIAIQTAYVICKEVDWDKKTMTAIGQTDDLEFYDIKLGFGSTSTKPKVDALCVIGLIENQAANAFLIAASEVDAFELVDSTGFKFSLNEGEMIITDGNGFEIKLHEGTWTVNDGNGYEVKLNDGTLTLNGDQFGGLIKVNELTTQIDKNTAILQAIQTAITSWTPVSNDGGAAFKAVLAAVPSMQRANLSNIKNDKIKHG